jgi:trigger factor
MPSSLTTSVEPLAENKVRLHVAVPASEFEKAVNAAFRKLAADVKIPGFRPGKAPRRLLEARFGPEVAREQALRDALPGYYAAAVDAEQLDTIAPPEIDITAGQEEGGVEFDAVVELRPIVTLDTYDGLRVEIPSPEIGEDAVDAQVEALRDRFADLEPKGAPLADNDYAEIDIKGYVHDEAIDAVTATDFLYEIGSGMVVPKLDEELRGKRPGDILKFNDVLPERFGDRAGDEVAFQVLVKDAKRKVLPEVTDDWVSEVTEFETLSELRTDIRKRLELVAAVQARMAVRDKALAAVGALVDVDLPESLVQQEAERRLHDLAHGLEARGATLSQYLEATGRREDELLATVRASATEAVRADLALRAIVAQEEIEVDDAELDAEIERLAQRLEEKPASVRRDLERKGLLEAVRSDVAKGKALKFLVEHATVVDEAGNELDLSLPEEANVLEEQATEQESQA